LPLELSALRTFAPWQLLFILSAVVLLALGFVGNTTNTLIILTSVLSFIYLIDVVFNLFVTLKSLHFPPEISATPDELKRLKDKDLPVYSVLCPLYKESRVLPDFVASMKGLDYPKSKLEILLLLEEDDTVTIDAARAMDLPSYFRILVVPHSSPKTKPKACNYGLAHARGEYIVIYDA
jgi:cellulose synthase/poly-beta-1,6-N-acetylglucosamine synthase-like glycosyltransferase